MLYIIYRYVYIHIYLFIYLGFFILLLYFIYVISYGIIFMCILLYMITYMLLSATSTHFKWELMLYCLHCPTLNKVFLLLLLPATVSLSVWQQVNDGSSQKWFK